MVNQEILGGLRAAAVRKQPMRNAMMSFLNAGYDRTEIQEAAISLRMEKRKPQQKVEGNVSEKPKLKKVHFHPKPKKDLKKLPKMDASVERVKNEKVRKVNKKSQVSAYEKSQPKKTIVRVLLVLIVAMLSLVFLGIVILVLAFRSEVVAFFSKLF